MRRRKVLEGGQAPGGRGMRPQPIRRQLVTLLSGFTQQCLPVVFMVRCTFPRRDKGLGDNMTQHIVFGLGTHPERVCVLCVGQHE